MQKKIISLILALSLITALSTSLIATAATSGFSATLNKESCRAGESLELTVSVQGSTSTIGAFIVYVEYDNSVFDYTKSVAGSKIKNGYYNTIQSDGLISFIYTTKTPAKSTDLTGDAITHYFTVREDMDVAQSSFKIRVEQIVSSDAKSSLDDVSFSLDFTVEEEPSDESRILELIPESGELEPEFDPDIYEYYLEVPFEITTMTFEYTISEGATSKINRKNLGTGGSDVDFIITVTSEDKKNVSKYTITVHRSEKSASSDDDESAGSKSSSSTKASTSSSSSKSSTSSKASTKSTASTASKANSSGTGTGSGTAMGVTDTGIETTPTSTYKTTVDLTDQAADTITSLELKRDEFMPYLAGIFTALICVIVGGIFVLIYCRESGKNTTELKHAAPRNRK